MACRFPVERLAPALSPKKLLHFLQIVQAGSVSRAADRLNMTQPALSRELRDLEAEIGVKLLRRHARGVSTTPAGEVLKSRAETVLGLLDTLREDVGAAADRPAGRVAIGMPVSMSGLFTVPLVHAFRERYPAVRLLVREGTTVPLRAALLARELDLAVLVSPISDAQLIGRPLFTEPLLLVGPPGAKLSPRRPVSLKTVAACPLVLPVMPNALRLQIETALEAAGHVPQVALEIDMGPMGQLVSLGLGYAILPSCAVATQPLVSASMPFAPIQGLSITWLVGLPAGVAMSLATAKMQQSLFERTRALFASGQLAGRYLGP